MVMQEGFKALPTDYAGFTFRSRTEARWAVFFDALHLKWDYEPQGFEFNGERYLPDFWLPHIDSWLEVKGIAPTMEELEKAHWLADGTGHDVLLAIGPPALPNGTWGDDDSSMWVASGVIGFDSAYWWCQCPHCGHIGAEFTGRAGRLRCPCPKTDDKTLNYDSADLRLAYLSARTAFTGPDPTGRRRWR